MANDVYTANADGSCYVGVFNTIVGVAQGGTVNQLASSVASSGFNLLTTAPAGTDIYRQQPHAGCAWDESRKAMWIFGAETHSVEANYDNSVYAFDTSDGLFKKMYEQSPWPAEYNIDEDGYLWANDAGTLPWAMHSYNRFYYDQATRTFILAMDSDFHSFTTPTQKGSIAIADRKKAMLQYNTLSKTWSQDWSAGIQSFNGFTQIHGAAYSPVWGWVSNNGTNLARLSTEGVYTATSVFGNTNTQYHDSSFFIGDNFIKFSGTGSATAYLCSIHPMNNLAASEIKLATDYPALSGWSTKNKPATAMADGRVMFLARNGADLGVFIYDVGLDTVTDTGHRLTGATGTDSTYDFKLEWSQGLNGAVYVSNMFGSPVRAYLIRI